MARAYRMTPARRAAIRKAQLASARKRRGRKKKVIGGTLLGAAGLGVVAVTLGRRYRGSSKKTSAKSKVNVVNTTMSPVNLSSSKEIDVVRWDTEISVVYDKNGVEKIDFSRIGKPLKTRTTKINRKQGKADKAAKGTKGSGRIRSSNSKGKYSTAQGLTKVKRDKPNDRAKRKRIYNSAARSKAYYESKNRKNPPAWLSKNYYQINKNKAKMRRILDTLNKSNGNYNPFNLI